MQTLTDEALILSVDKFGDHDAIVHLFTAAHGVLRGVVKRGFSGKGRADLQPATLVVAQWKARLPEHLGTVTLEAKHSYAARVMHDRLRLAAVGSMMGLLGLSLAERDPHPELYHQAVGFLQHAAADVEATVWLSEYVRLELALLEQAGFGLDLSSCAATGETADLVYVSPKSGRAVSRGAGEPYHERMLALPEFLKEGDGLPGSMDDIAHGLATTGHFLEARLMPALHRNPPPIRAHFVGLLTRAAAQRN
jgi:DNA repair protein RecO (recombination protein O)